jgi:hypothetical protein
MTINHIYLLTTPTLFPTLRTFYTTVLAPLKYRPYYTSDGFAGFGSDYPYFWLKAAPYLPVPNSQTPNPKEIVVLPTHIAFDAPTRKAVDEFYALAIEAGAEERGKPGVREEHGVEGYYAAYVRDRAGNNVEAVCIGGGK